MGFLDKAKKLAEEAQAKLDEAQRQFNAGQSSDAPSGPVVEYDKHGRPIEPPAGSVAPPSPFDVRPPGPPPSMPSGDPLAQPVQPEPPAGVTPAESPQPPAPPTSGDPLAPTGPSSR